VTLCIGMAERLLSKDAVFDFVFHCAGINFLNDQVAALREVIHVVKTGTKFVFGDESEALAKKNDKLPVAGHL